MDGFSSKTACVTTREISGLVFHDLAIRVKMNIFEFRQISNGKGILNPDAVHS